MEFLVHCLKHCLEHCFLFVESSLPESMVYSGNIKRLSTSFYLILLMYLGSLIAFIDRYSYKPKMILQEQWIVAYCHRDGDHTE